MPRPCSWWPRTRRLHAGCTMQNEPCGLLYQPPPTKLLAALPLERSERDNLLGEIAAYSAIITGYHLGEESATLAFCQQALAHLSEQNLLVRAEVAYAQSLAYHSCGDIVAAIQNTSQAAALAQAAGNTSSTIFYLCRMA